MPQLPWRQPNPTSAWRTEVRPAAQQLRDQFDLLTPQEQQKAAAILARQELDEALKVANEARSITSWWSGDQVERAWRAVKEAKANLILVHPEVSNRQRITLAGSALYSLAASAVAAAAGQSQTHHHRAVVAANAASDQQFSAARQLRNMLWIVTALLAVFISIAFILDEPHRPLILIGGLAGAFTAILPLASTTKLSVPYAVTLTQIILKIPAGATAALLGVYFLQGSVGALAPATGVTAYFYAVLFGLSQQALTGLADTQAKKLTS